MHRECFFVYFVGPAQGHIQDLLVEGWVGVGGGGTGQGRLPTFQMLKSHCRGNDVNDMPETWWRVELISDLYSTT